METSQADFKALEAKVDDLNERFNLLVQATADILVRLIAVETDKEMTKVAMRNLLASQRHTISAVDAINEELKVLKNTN